MTRVCPDILLGCGTEGGLRGEDDDKKWLLTRIRIQSLRFQPYKSHFTCLPLDYRTLHGQTAGEQPGLLPRKEGIGILPGAFPWAACFPTDSKIRLCLQSDYNMGKRINARRQESLLSC